MGYTWRILQESSPGKGRRRRTVVPKPLQISRAACAFCRGTGEDPKIRYSQCPVCGGQGLVTVYPPVLECAFCGAHGRAPWSKFSCPVCRGKGLVSVREPLVLCAKCRGTGGNPAGRLYCITCGGKGVVSGEAAKK